MTPNQPADHAAQAARAQHVKELQKLAQVMRECEQGQLVCPVYLTRIEALEAGASALLKEEQQDNAEQWCDECGRQPDTICAVYKHKVRPKWPLPAPPAPEEGT